MSFLFFNQDRNQDSNQDSQTAERLESLKAGIVGKLTAMAAAVPLMLLHYSLVLHHPLAFEKAGWQNELLQINSFISLAIVLLSGFLFGVTYRYVVRQDNNPQLQSGAVGAFALVRSLAQIEENLDKKMPLWIWGIEIVESMVLFGAIALSLNWAMGRGWIQRMK